MFDDLPVAGERGPVQVHELPDEAGAAGGGLAGLHPAHHVFVQVGGCQVRPHVHATGTVRSALCVQYFTVLNCRAG